MILAISLHEAMHGYVASMLGDNTAKFLGRVTLNPFKHIDPVGTLLVPSALYLFTGTMFGWAKPVPVAFQNLRNPKRDMAIVAAAGPVANLLEALCASACLFAVTALVDALSIGDAAMRTVVQPLVLILFFMLQFNLFLMVFNLIPVPPLDGGRILVGLLPHRAAAAWAQVEPYGIYVIVLLLLSDRYLHTSALYVTPVRFLMRVLTPDVLHRLVGG
jgi:Zn-dependent protease